MSGNQMLLSDHKIAATKLVVCGHKIKKSWPFFSSFRWSVLGVTTVDHLPLYHPLLILLHYIFSSCLAAQNSLSIICTVPPLYMTKPFQTCFSTFVSKLLNLSCPTDTMLLALLPSHLISCTHNISTFLLSITSATSLSSVNSSTGWTRTTLASSARGWHRLTNFNVFRKIYQMFLIGQDTWADPLSLFSCPCVLTTRLCVYINMRVFKGLHARGQVELDQHESNTV